MRGRNVFLLACFGLLLACAAFGFSSGGAPAPAARASEQPTHPLPYDAAAKGITGFAFEITGETVPTALRFGVEGASEEYCTTAATPVKLGKNSFTFDQLFTQCYTTGGDTPSGNDLLKLEWQVVTNASSTVPFDFCVTNIRALTE